MEYIPIEKERVPYQFEIDLGNGIFVIEVNYNATFDFFTIDLYKDDEVLVLGAKLVYGVPLFAAFETSAFPIPLIKPYDLSGQEQTVSWDNLGETVFLFYGEETDNE